MRADATDGSHGARKAQVRFMFVTLEFAEVLGPSSAPWP